MVPVTLITATAGLAFGVVTPGSANATQLRHFANVMATSLACGFRKQAKEGLQHKLENLQVPVAPHGLIAAVLTFFSVVHGVAIGCLLHCNVMTMLARKGQ